MSIGDKRIGLIGTGRMGEALTRGILRAGIAAPSQLSASDLDRARLERLARELKIEAGDNLGVAARSDLLILAVKPPDTVPALEGVRSALRDGQVVVSLAAGVTLGSLAKVAPAGVWLVRVMPNTPCLVGEGATGIAAPPGTPPEAVELAEAVFGVVGRTVRVDEKLLDAVTGLSGSGPAYVFVMIEALADGGVAAGLPRQTALELAAQTVLGAARMVLETGDHPGQLKDQVASPGGTTMAGLAALEESGFRSALIRAVAAAARRAKELAC